MDHPSGPYTGFVQGRFSGKCQMPEQALPERRCLRLPGVIGLYNRTVTRSGCPGGERGREPIKTHKAGLDSLHAMDVQRLLQYEWKSDNNALLKRGRGGGSRCS